MVDLLRLVEKELRNEYGSDEIIALWQKIHSWHEDGGPASVEVNLKNELKSGEKEVSENIRAMPEIKTRKKSKRRRLN